MRAARYVDTEDRVRIGRVEDGLVIDAGESGPRGFVPTPAAWQALAQADGEANALEAVRLLAPVVPQKVLCIGLNYRAHAEEQGADVPAAPLIFAKLPSCLIADGETIVLPRQEPKVDFEAEVAVVLGARVKDATPAQARAAIGGCTAMNDVSGRAAQRGDRQWTRAKSFDTFGPIGPYIASPESFEWTAVGVQGLLNGELVQDSSTADLIFPILDLVVYLSAQFTLEAGDVISTGTPSGVGFARTPPRFLRDGDVFEVRVDGVGSLTNPVADAAGRSVDA